MAVTTNPGPQDPSQVPAQSSTQPPTPPVTPVLAQAPQDISAQVRGQTIRLTWTEGPAKGTTHEHVFHDDGTVEWRALEGAQSEAAPLPVEAGAAAAEAAKPVSQDDRPPYSCQTLADDISLVSYRSRSGHTLTVALRFYDNTVLGIASNDSAWFPVKGIFEVMG